MRRTLLIVGAAAVISGGAVAGVVATRGSGGKGAAADPGFPPATAKVIRTTLVETKTVPGTLGYGDSVPIRAARGGTITWIAPVGSTVMRSEPLFKIDQRPVVDLYGSLPIYRTLREGTAGADVKQLERDLVALGFAGFSVDQTYDAATAAAVRAWQAKLGLPETGTVEPGQVVMTPGPIRIAAHTARVGDTTGRGSAEGGASVLSYTATTRRVTVGLEVADAALAVPGRTVRVKVPSQPAVRGKIASVGSVVTAQRTTADGGAASTDGAPETSGNPEASGSVTSDARIEVTVTIANQKALGSLVAAPVDVEFVSSERKDVLAVPVAALLALPKQGFGVQVVEGEATRIVPVRTGMFAAGRVEVSGPGIAEGMSVGVPK